MNATPRTKTVPVPTLGVPAALNSLDSAAA